MTLEQQVQRLLDIEAIKSLKARYFRCMDCKDWDGLEQCFTEDLEADFREAPGMLAHGRENYLGQLREVLSEAVTVHRGHMAEIAFTTEDRATGVWAMEDIVELPGMSLRGWGHYHDHYRREQGEWRISSIRLTRLKLEQG